MIRDTLFGLQGSSPVDFFGLFTFCILHVTNTPFIFGYDLLFSALLSCTMYLC